MDKRSKQRIDRHLTTSGARATKKSVANLVAKLSPEEQKQIRKDLSKKS